MPSFLKSLVDKNGENDSASFPYPTCFFIMG